MAPTLTAAVRQTIVGRSRPSCPETWTADGKSDNMIAGRENGHIALANFGYARVSTIDQNPAASVTVTYFVPRLFQFPLISPQRITRSSQMRMRSLQ